jgi:hypothetical protein
MIINGNLLVNLNTTSNSFISINQATQPNEVVTLQQLLNASNQIELNLLNTSNQLASYVNQNFVKNTGGTISGNLSIDGDLIVNGSNIVLDYASLNVGESYIILNSSSTVPVPGNSGIEISRGNQSPVYLVWNESDLAWQMSDQTGTYYNIASTVTINSAVSQLNTEITNLSSQLTNTSSILSTEISNLNSNLNNVNSTLTTEISNLSSQLNNDINSINSTLSTLYYIYSPNTTGTTFTITHNLNQLYVLVMCYNADNNMLVYPDSVQLLSPNQLTVTFGLSINPVIVISK